MAGRPKLPVELKSFKGTLNTTRAKNEIQKEKIINSTPLVFSDVKKVSCPKEITDSYVRKFWKNYTQALLSVHAFGAGDIPQFTRLCVLLQKIREVQAVLIELSVFDKSFDTWERRYKHLSEHFDQLASKFYLSPAERSKMKLDQLTVIKAEQDIVKNQSAIGRLLQK